MLKVVVFDCGYGGEFFADRLEEELPVVDVIRVIDWRHAKTIQTSSRQARKLTEASLRPYINKVDLIILANYLVSITSLKYFRRKYKKQRFIGFNLIKPDSFIKRDTLILTTRAVSKTITYYNFIMHLNRKYITLSLDSWPGKIDDGELSAAEINETLEKELRGKRFHPEEVVLACSQFEDIKSELRNSLGYNIKIHDSFNETFRKTCKTLKLRGRTGKKSS